MTYQETPPPPPSSGWPAPAPSEPRKSKKKMWLIGGGVLLLLLIAYGAGTGNVQKGFEDGMAVGQATPAPTPEPTPSVTPDPTATPTPEPTPRPTPEPTPRPTPEPTLEPGAMDYVEFVGWTLGYGDSTMTELDALSSDLDNYDAWSAIEHARKLLKINKDAKTWLAKHPPAACYAGQHSKISRAVDNYIDAFTAQVKWLDQFPYGSDKLVETFSTKIDRATQLVGEATEGQASCGF